MKLIHGIGSIFVFQFHKILSTISKGSMATQAQISIRYNSSFVVDPNSYTMFVALLNIKTSDGNLDKIFCRGKKITQNH